MRCISVSRIQPDVQYHARMGTHLLICSAHLALHNPNLFLRQPIKLIDQFVYRVRPHLDLTLNHFHALEMHCI